MGYEAVAVDVDVIAVDVGLDSLSSAKSMAKSTGKSISSVPRSGCLRIRTIGPSVSRKGGISPAQVRYDFR